MSGILRLLRLRFDSAAVTAGKTSASFPPTTRGVVVFSSWIWPRLYVSAHEAGAYLRAATENPSPCSVRINLPRMKDDVRVRRRLAGLAGVLASRVPVNPLWAPTSHRRVRGSRIGGLGSIMGSIRHRLARRGEGFTKVFYPEASNTVIFVIMALVLLVRPSGLFGRSA